MIELTGNNICKRQQELNVKVNEAVICQVNFEDIKDKPEHSDVDKLFKIDVAAKYKKLDYVIEVLKSGDSLYISRILKKCTWLFDNNYSSVINVDYLHHNIFPFMSAKMKRKFLTLVSTSLNNEIRAIDFYKYCLRTKLSNLADKFLTQTSESFKLNYLENDFLNNDIKYVKTFIGNSFSLLEFYFNKQPEYNRFDIQEFRNLFLVSEEKYLDLLEKHVKIKSHQCLKGNSLGLRISKQIMVNHKSRVLNNPKLYINLLNSSKIVRHSNSHDAKLYIDSLMPKEVSDFWTMNFYNTYSYILNIIPENERYIVIQETFTRHYPSEDFETNKLFYIQNYYNLLTLPQQEKWALRLIESGKDLLSDGRYYLWYKFVSFEKAFVELKKYIKSASNANKRCDIIKVLVDSTKNQSEVEELLKYYYERHVNESRANKESFVNRIMHNHNVLKFDNNCWAAFDKLLCSLKIYKSVEGNGNLKIVSILYHILNEKPLTDSLELYLDSNLSTYSFKPYVDKFSEEEKQRVYDYIFAFYLKKIESIDLVPKDAKELQETKSNLVLYIHFLLEFMAMYKKTQKDIPDSVMKFIKLDTNLFRYHQILEEEKKKPLTEEKLLKDLKEDAQRLIDNIKDLESALTSYTSIKINNLLKKLRIYFADDISKEYLTYFQQLLIKKINRNAIASAVLAIFLLSDESTKITLMNKYSPVSAKINYENFDLDHLTIQENICRFACYSRPPVPLSIMLKYMVGDYVHFCLPMFSMYLSNLPQPLCLKFVQSTIHSPVSIQKHGLRLAFQCFDAENLNKLILDSWKKTKNVSLRSIIYRAFYKKAVEEESREYYNVLKTLTADLNEDDDEIFDVLSRPNFSHEFLGEFVEVLWGTVQSFTNSEKNIIRKRNIISSIDKNLKLMKREILRSLIDELLKSLIDENAVMKYALDDFIDTKWDLVAHYVVYFTNSEADRKESTDLAKFILKHCFENWDKNARSIYIFRQICFDFIKKLDRKSLSSEINNYEHTNCVFDATLVQLEATLPLYEIYMYVWQLRVKILTNKLLESSRNKMKLEMIGGSTLIFGNAVGKLIQELVEKKIYFSCFLKDFVDIVDGYINEFVYSNIVSDAGVTYHDVLLDVARGLLQCESSETSLFALQLLPKDLEKECDLNNCQDVINVLRAKANMEVSCSLYSKYFSDCKRRRFV